LLPFLSQSPLSSSVVIAPNPGRDHPRA
jgi:hypothetical protein